MKIKIFLGDKPIELENEVNEFIKDKKVIDIKINEWTLSDDCLNSGNTILVLYDDSISKF